MAHLSADYDVERQRSFSSDPNELYVPPGSHSASRSSQLLPSVISSNLDSHSLNTFPPAPDAHLSASEAHEFYRQYRDSFTERQHSGSIYVLDPETPEDDASDRMTSVMGPPRVSHFETKANGLPAASVTVRLNNLAKKASQEGFGKRDGRDGTTPGLPRGRQSSLRDRINKFESSQDQILPMPTSKPGSRSTSAHTSPATMYSQRSFRNRTPSAKPSSEESSRAERTRSGTEHMPGDDHGLHIRKRISSRNSGDPRAPYGSRHISDTSYNNASASHSMTNLPAQSIPLANGQKPLFGEIVAGQADQGWGIPRARPRSGPEGSVFRPTSIFRDDTELESYLTPPSMEAWYNGQGPNLDQIDILKAQPRSGRLQHQRSRSDMSGLRTLGRQPEVFSSQTGSNALATTPTKAPRLSKLPLPARDSSYAHSQNKNNFSRDVSHTRQNLRSTMVPPSQVSRSNCTDPNLLTAPTHSLRRHGAPPTLSTISPRLGAFIHDVGAPEPAKSPPLRSSRNRGNMASASTAASRGKTIERASTAGGGANRANKAQKSLPELGGVDFATRRERIQRAFSKSVEAKEAEQRRSLIIEAHRRKQEESEVPPVPLIDQSLLNDSTKPSTQEGASRSATDSRPPESSTNLKIDTHSASQLPVNARRESADDSPTLGALNLGNANATNPTSPADTERRSSYTSSGTYLEDEAQDTPAMQQELSTHPTPEGVHVVLGGVDSSERCGAESHERAMHQNGSRWSLSSWASSVDSTNRYSADRTDARLESIDELHDSNEQKVGHAAQPSFSTNRTSFTEQPMWSPDVDLSKNNSSSSVGDMSHAPSSGHFGQLAKRTTEEQRDSLSPSTAASVGAGHRASLMSPADFAAASPSIGDWISHQAMDTPVEERSKHSFSDRTDDTSGRPVTPKTTNGPQLPEIQTAGSDWGFELRSDSPRRDVNARNRNPVPRAPAPSRNVSGLPPSAAFENPRSPPPAKPRTPLSKFNSHADHNDIHNVHSQPDFNSQIQATQGRASPTTQNQAQPAESKALTEAEQSARDAEQKRLTRRKNIIKELVDTESSFGQDMTVVVDIYKETSHVILQNNPEDVKILFGNATEIVQFSMKFLDSLKVAVNNVYKLPKSKRLGTKRDSSVTADSSNADESSSISNLELTEDERDRMTSIGQCFEEHMDEMEKFYTEYLKNHEAASAKLLQLQKSDKVQIWLTECRSYAHDLTTAWDLDSLLVKPVQRILKYPLLLRELVEVTPENHPDFMLLDTASREIVGLSQRINMAKKRADLIEQATEKTEKIRKKSENDSRNFLSKKFNRNKDKLRQPVGLTDVQQDKFYNVMADKFGSHFFQVQVVMRDVEVYTVDVQGWVSKFDDFVGGIEEFMDVSRSPYPEVESKWRIFRSSVRELQSTALTDHLAAVRKHAIEPMATLLKLYDGPQKMMEKRKKRVLDHARWRAAQEAHIKIDKKTVEQGEQFVALNDTLKEELPKLFAGTKTLVEACLNNFVQLQLQWQIIWRRKLTGAVDMRNPPRDVKDIIEAFSGDFKFTEAQVLGLGIANGTLLQGDLTTHSSAATTLNGDASSSRQTSLTYDDAREARMLANQTASSCNRAASAHSQNQFTSPNAPYYPAAYAQGPLARNRASSTASGRSREPQTWSTSSTHLLSPQGTAPPSGRPSSQSQRTNSGFGQTPYDSHGYPRYSEDLSRSSHWYQNLHMTSSRTSESQLGIGAALAGAGGAAAAPARGSAIFSSALPPEITPPPSASMQSQPTLDPNADHERHANGTPSQYNVLFLAASVYEFNIDRARREAGYPYLTYAAGEIFDVIGEKGELWLAKNQDDSSNTLGWIWNKHFAKLANES